MTENNQDILKITKRDQYRTVEELFEHSKSSSVYYTLLVLSSLIVASGLLLSNSTIVIGGMLVAPLLTPILTIALGLAVGEGKAVKEPLKLILISFFIIAGISAVLAFVFGVPEGSILVGDSLKVALLYFIVASASGIAATFAWIRKEISEVLPGIAVAVSLVPPLSLVGIWFSALDFELVRSYSFIFLLNLFGILAGSLIVFSFLKFHRVEKKVKKEGEEIEEEKEKIERAERKEERERIEKENDY